PHDSCTDRFVLSLIAPIIGWQRKILPTSIHETDDRGRHLIGFVKLGEMSSPGDDSRLSLALDGARNGGGVAARHQAITLTPQDQGRRGNERKTPFQTRIAERPEDAGRRLRRARLLDWPLDRIGTGGDLLEFAVDIGIRRHETRNIIWPLR